MRWVTLGDYIEQSDERNSNNVYNIEHVKGVSINKILINTKADMEGVSLTPYKIVRKNEFVFVTITSRNGGKISLAMNNSSQACIVSSSYEVFRVNNPLELLPEFLYLWFCRPEFDRYARFNSWGSAREAFSFDEMCRIKFPLPDINEQRKIVSVWKGLRDLKAQNEAIAEPLFALCQSYLKQLKEEYEPTEIGPYIELYDKVNSSEYNYPIIGINKNKEFMPTVANIENLDIKKYKLISNKIFVFSGMQTGRDVCIRIGLYNENYPALMSPAYTTFILKKNNELIPEFLFLCFNNEEMDRYGWFISDSSVRANLDWSRFLEIRIPLPPIEKQQAIVNIYNCAKEAKEIANKAEQLIKDICPALMRQVIGEAS